MNLLYSSLKSIYDSDTLYIQYSPLDPLYLSLKNFLIENLNKGDEIVDPIEFAHKYHLSSIKSLDLFLLLSQYGIFEKEYFLKCDDCGTSIIEKNIEDFYQCFVCKNLFTNNSNPINYNIFNNIKYVFQINEDLYRELNYDLKEVPSSSFNIPEEEGTYKSVNVNDLLNTKDSSLNGIELEKKILERLSKGILNIS